MKYFLISIILISASAVLAPQAHSALLQVGISGSIENVASNNPVDVIQNGHEFHLGVVIDTDSLNILGQADNRVRYRGLISVLTIDGQLIPTTVNSSIYLLDNWTSESQSFDWVILTAAFIWDGISYSIGTSGFIADDTFDVVDFLTDDHFPLLSSSTILRDSGWNREFWDVNVSAGSLVEVTSVPLPGAIWLLATAVIGLGGVGRIGRLLK